MVQSKQKGNTFERKISNILSERFQEYTGKEKSFIRNIDSGSYYGASNQSRIDTHSEELHKFGDILAPDAFKWSIECKAYKTAPSVDSILKQKYALFDEWIEQAEQDAINDHKEPLLVIKFNHTEIFVMIKQGCTSIYRFKYKDYYAYTLDDFLGYDGDHWYFKDNNNEN